MKVYRILVLVILSWVNTQAQTFDISLSSENLKASIGETVQNTLRIKNNDSKTVNLIIRRSQASLGSTQKVQLCLHGTCADELTMRVEPGQSIADLTITFEAGFSPGISSARYVVFNKANPTDAYEFDVNFMVEEFAERKFIYDSPNITMTDAYPNPAVESAQLDFKIHRSQPSYTIIIRNLLGNIVGEYRLESTETKLKMRTDDLNAGIYFFTLYIDSDGVLTRKMMVKK